MKKPLFTKTIQLMIWLMLMIAVIGLVLGHRLMLYYFEKEKEDITTVSYTHLDVYKRQQSL